MTVADLCGSRFLVRDVEGDGFADCDLQRGHDGRCHPGATIRAEGFVCDLCWLSFPSREELSQHIAMENAVNWSIDQLDDDDQEPSTKAARL